MGVTCGVRIETIFDAFDTYWTDHSADVVASEGIRCRYGIPGHGALDRCASTGELQFTLRNDAGASHATQAYYSLSQPIVLLSSRVRLVLTHGSDSNKSVSGITRSSQTATATSTAHGYSSNQYVLISGAGQPEYNGVHKITVTGADTFTFPVLGSPATPATGTITARRAYVKFHGIIRNIEPTPGQYREQRVRITAYDWIGTLAELSARNVELQVDKTEVELIEALMATIPDSTPALSLTPLYTSYDTAVDTYPYTYGDQGPAQILSALRDVVVSAWGKLYQAGDGTLTYLSRSTLQTRSSSGSFSNTMHGASGSFAASALYNRARVTVHPKTISASANEELFSLPSTVPIEIPVGTTEYWVSYSDPNDRQTPVGGLSVVTALVNSTHYSINSASDGTGIDLAAAGYVSVSVTPFARAAKFSFLSSYTAPAYVRTLKVIGKAVRDLGPYTHEHWASTYQYGDRTLDIDLRYQDDTGLARNVAQYAQQLYGAAAQRTFGAAIEFLANDSSALMTHALTREPCDFITVTDTMSQPFGHTNTIQSVELRVTPGPMLRCRWTMAPADSQGGMGVFWQLGVTGAGELGTAALGL